jgi:hypothetical protein
MESNFSNVSTIPSVIQTSGEGLSSSGPKFHTVTPTVPRTDIGVLRVAQDVFPQWDTAKYPLIYTTREEVSNQISILENNFTSVRQIRGKRSPETNRLKELDKLIDNHIESVKRYVADDFGRKAAVSHYPAFSIELVSGKYNLPKKRALRVRALSQLIEAIEKYGYGAFRFGTEFWTGIYTEYAELERSTRSFDGSSTADTAAKNKAKTFCMKWLRSIMRIYEANHPEDWTEKLRTLGFQKEKY